MPTSNLDNVNSRNRICLGPRIEDTDRRDFDGMKSVRLWVPNTTGGTDLFQYQLSGPSLALKHFQFKRIQSEIPQSLLGIGLLSTNTDTINYNHNWWKNAPEYIKRYVLAHSNGHIVISESEGGPVRDNVVLLLHSLPVVDIVIDTKLDNVEVTVDAFTGNNHSSGPSTYRSMYGFNKFGESDFTVPVNSTITLKKRSNSTLYGVVISDLYSGKVLHIEDFKSGETISKFAYEWLNNHPYKSFRITEVENTKTIYAPDIGKEQYREPTKPMNRLLFYLENIESYELGGVYIYSASQRTVVKKIPENVIRNNATTIDSLVVVDMVLDGIDLYESDAIIILEVPSFRNTGHIKSKPKISEPTDTRIAPLQTPMITSLGIEESAYFAYFKVPYSVVLSF